MPEASAVELFPELAGCALVRELHVYGQLVAAVIPGNKEGAARTPAMLAIIVLR